MGFVMWVSKDTPLDGQMEKKGRGTFSVDWKDVGDKEFMNRFSLIMVKHLPKRTFNHGVISIELEAKTQRNRSKHVLIFIFKEVWTKDVK